MAQNEVPLNEQDQGSKLKLATWQKTHLSSVSLEVHSHCASWIWLSEQRADLAEQSA